jgi:glycosyltransferase involved in cell wall biosynthesis
MQPMISILIPSYNASATIRSAILSCLSQTYQDFEIIVLNPGSKDHTNEIIESFDDKRLTLLQTENNTGIAASRNILLKAAKGQFIAWLDADDIMMPERLEKQLNYFEKFPETDILGTWISTDSDEVPIKRLPLKHNEIYHCLWFKNCMIQPSIMSRNFYLKEQCFYDENFANSVEDYELWYRLRNSKKLANLNEVLTHYHMTVGEELNLKKRHNNFDSNLHKLWEIKWRNYPVAVSESERKSFIKFLYENIEPDEHDIKASLNVIYQLNILEKDDFFRLLLSYHKLRLWRNMRIADKLRHLKILTHLKYWNEFKQRHLI